eukprot:360622-Chlamydomonas_euryale.AAC.10
MVQPDHVMTALHELGFGEFQGSVTAAWEEHKEEAAYINEPEICIFHVLAAMSDHRAAMKKSHAQNDYTEEELVSAQADQTYEKLGFQNNKFPCSMGTGMLCPSYSSCNVQLCSGCP